MMMRHYQDAIRIFVNCLLFIQRTRNINQQQQHQQKSWQYDVVSLVGRECWTRYVSGHLSLGSGLELAFLC